MSTRHRHQLSRRDFSCGVLSAAAAGLVGRIGAAAAAEAAPPAGKYVDVHVHLTQDWAALRQLTRTQLLRWMDEHQVAQAVVLPLVSPEGWYYLISNDWVLEQTRPCRDRLIPFCDIDPRSQYLKPKDILALLTRYLEAGAKGLGEHKCGGAIDDPGNLAIFRACSELKLPVLFHMDAVRNVDQPGLPGLERCLREAPGAMFLGHATSFWASICGAPSKTEFVGYPKGPVRPGGALDRLMDQYENLYGDLSAGSGLNAIQRDPDFGREFIMRRADRLLFGTDYLADGQQVGQFALFDQLDLPEAVKAKVFRDNARRLLRLG